MVTRALLSPADVRSLLRGHGLRSRQSLGQNFLADPNTARRIVRLAGVGPGDRVLEIGAGVGSLTLALAEQAAHVLALEIDRSLVAVLADTTRNVPNVRIVEGDGLRLDYDTLLGSSGSASGSDGPDQDPDDPDPDGRASWCMVSNLPYNVATPLVARMLETVPQVKRMLVMVQREVGERFVALPGSRVYGAISVKIAYYAQARLVGLVPPTVFIPEPKVTSALVTFERHATPPVEVPDSDWLFRVVRAGFAQRRKMLRRALQPMLGAEVDGMLSSAGIDPTARAETLGLEQWAALARVSAEARQ